LNRNQFPALIEALEQNCHQSTLKLICYRLSNIHVTIDLYRLEERQIVGTFGFRPH